MAIHEDHSRISNSNLPLKQFEKVIQALDNDQCDEVPDSHHMFNESRTWQVVFEGAVYNVSECYEWLTGIHLVSAPSNILEMLKEELQKELDAARESHSYLEAHVIYSRLKSLKKIDESVLAL